MHYHHGLSNYHHGSYRTACVHPLSCSTTTTATSPPSFQSLTTERRKFHTNFFCRHIDAPSSIFWDTILAAMKNAWCSSAKPRLTRVHESACHVAVRLADASSSASISSQLGRRYPSWRHHRPRRWQQLLCTMI
jgi:hypothetical protein